ncbi:MAG: sugar transferase [Oscillospiraceae bacterium]|nr:sugar transferase [Oscillospiraceae bacterium]
MVKGEMSIIGPRPLVK